MLLDLTQILAKARETTGLDPLSVAPHVFARQLRGDFLSGWVDVAY